LSDTYVITVYHAQRMLLSLPTRHSSDLGNEAPAATDPQESREERKTLADQAFEDQHVTELMNQLQMPPEQARPFIERNFKKLDEDRKSTRLNSSHVKTSYAVFCLKKKKK